MKGEKNLTLPQNRYERCVKFFNLTPKSSSDSLKVILKKYFEKQIKELFSSESQDELKEQIHSLEKKKILTVIQNINSMLRTTGQTFLFVFDDFNDGVQNEQDYIYSKSIEKINSSFDLLKLIISDLTTLNLKILITSRFSQDIFMIKHGLEMLSITLVDQKVDQKKTQEYFQQHSHQNNISNELQASDGQYKEAIKFKDEPLAILEWYPYFEKRGYALLINNIDLQKPLEQKKIEETNSDTNRLKEVLEKIGFDVLVETNKTHDEILGYLKMYGEVIDHSQNDCFLCVLMSNGDQNGIWGSDVQVIYNEEKSKIKDVNKYIDLETTAFDLFNSIKFPSLKGKPKLFFNRTYLFQTLAKYTKKKLELISTKMLKLHNNEAIADFFFGFVKTEQLVDIPFSREDLYIQEFANALEIHGKSKELRFIMDEVKRGVT